MNSGESKQLDSTTLTQWHAQYYSRITAFVFGILRDKTLTEEAVQTTFTNAFTAGGNVQHGSEKAWLFQVAYNEAMIVLRKQKSRKQQLVKIQNQFSTDIRTNQNPIYAILGEEQAEEIQRALRQLPEDLRTIVNLRIYEEKTFQQIADELGIPLGTALTRMRTALQHLKSVLRQSNDD